MNGGGIVGRLAPPFVSDLVGRFNVMTPCAFLLGLSALVFWVFAKTLVSILLFAILYGFLSGAFIAMLIPCVAQISEGEKLKEIGTRIGLLYSIISFAYVDTSLNHRPFTSLPCSSPDIAHWRVDLQPGRC